ncbi:MAG TPA: DUF4337 domain-containing protein [Terracidiphilus sp.]|jgi:hypothetical protein|nr:DUF4337 domain-containing protein [Terracidiphilus sp.]
MEANEAQELKERAENAEKESALRPVAFTMSVLAVLVAVTTVLGHRTHTEAVLNQNKATDQWNLYQAHKIRAYETTIAQNQLRVITVGNKDEAAKQARDYADHQAKWADETRDDKAKAEALEAKVEQAEARADRFDLGEALLEIGLVITSVTLLTRSRIYWYFGIVFSLGGIVSAVSAYFLR